MKKFQKISIVLLVFLLLVAGFVACGPKVESVTFSPEGGELETAPEVVTASWETRAPEASQVYYKINGGVEKEKSAESDKTSVKIASADLVFGTEGAFKDKLVVEVTLKDKDGGELAKGKVEYTKKSGQ